LEALPPNISVKRITLAEIDDLAGAQNIATPALHVVVRASNRHGRWADDMLHGVDELFSERRVSR